MSFSLVQYSFSYIYDIIHALGGGHEIGCGLGTADRVVEQGRGSYVEAGSFSHCHSDSCGLIHSFLHSERSYIRPFIHPPAHPSVHSFISFNDSSVH